MGGGQIHSISCWNGWEEAKSSQSRAGIGWEEAKSSQSGAGMGGRRPSPVNLVLELGGRRPRRPVNLMLE